MKVNWNARASESGISEAARVLLTPRHPGGSLESTETSEGRKPIGEKERLQRLSESLASASPTEDDGSQEEVKKRVMEGAASGLAKLNEGEPAASFTVGEQIGLEAVILTGGERPSLFVRQGTIDFSSPDIGDWSADLWRVKTKITSVANSVGRINVPVAPYFAGTCFAIYEGLVLTNRHVLEAIASPDANGGWIFKWPKQTFIDFVGEDGNAASTNFAVTGVKISGPDMINNTVNFSHLDMAVLHVDAVSNSASVAFPANLNFESSIASPGFGQDIYVMGFPGKPIVWQFGTTPPPQTETSEVLSLLFSNRFGVKRLAPGVINAGPGQVAGDEKKWIFSHDASTLGGNSGSCIIDLSGDGCTVVGLHFAGVNRQQNWAHAAGMLQRFLQNSGHLVS